MNEEKQILLQKLLDEQKIKHKKQIVLEETLKDAHIYCKVNKLPGQSTGPLLEHFIITKFGLKKNNKSDCIGDFCKDGTDYEYKSSNGGVDHNQFNFVQLRPNHRCDYLLSAYHISYSNIDQLGELYIFKIAKQNMVDIIKQYGDYAHGTKEKQDLVEESLKNNNNYEYAIRPKYNDNVWNELMKYRITEDAI